MPDAVLYARPDHARADQRTCLTMAETLGYRVHAVTASIVAALELVESGEVKVFLCVDPRVLGDRRDEVRRRLEQAGGNLEFCKPSPRRARPLVDDRASRAILLLEEAIVVLRDIPQQADGRSPGRPMRRPRPRR